MATISNDHKALAHTALRVLLQAELPAEQWREVEAQVQNLQRALEQEDADAFCQARKRLEQLSQPRIGRIGTDPKTPLQPPQPQTRDFINHMVETLQARQRHVPPQDTPKRARQEHEVQ